MPPNIYLFSKCLRVETSFWTGGCTHTPAKCQSSYMRKKCIASNLITTCRVLIKKKKKISLPCSVKERGTSFQFLPFIFFFAYAILSFLNLIFCCSLFALFYLSRLVTKGKAEGIANCSQLLLLSTLIIQVENKTSCSEIV